MHRPRVSGAAALAPVPRQPVPAQLQRSTLGVTQGVALGHTALQLLGDLLRELCGAFGVVLAVLERIAHGDAPLLQLLAKRLQVFADAVGNAKVREEESLRPPRLNQLPASCPAVQVNVGRRRDGEYGLPIRDPNA